MPKNREKIERNKIREKYAREYAGKLRSKDADIRNLLDRNSQLRDENARLKERLALEQISVARLDELVTTLQKWADASDSELKMLKEDLMQRHEAEKSINALETTLKPIASALGTIGTIGLGRHSTFSSIFSSIFGQED